MKTDNHVNVQYPIAILAKLYNKTESRIKITFFCAMAAGLLAHAYQFTNKLFNYDELGHTPEGFGSGIELGRWGLEFFGRLTKLVFGNYSLPMVNGMIALLFFAISACLIVSILDIQDCILAGLTGALCTVFPAVTSTYFFMYTAPYYALALLLSCIASWLVIKRPKSKLILMLAVVLLALATGIYQSYFTIAACLLLSDLILTCMDNQESTIEKYSWNDVLKRGIKELLFLIFGLLLYFIVNKIVLYCSGIMLLDYQGISDMGKVGFHELFSSVIRCYSDFIRVILSDVLQTNPTWIVKFGILVLGLIMFAVLIKVLADKQKTIGIKLLLLLFILLFPIAVFLIYIMAAGGAYVYTLMSYSLIFIFLTPLASLERVLMRKEEQDEKKRLLQTVVSWGGTLSATVVVLVYIWFANGNYQALQYTNYHDLAYYTVMMAQVKSLEGYRDELPVAVIGETITDETNRAGALLDSTFNIGGKSSTNISSYSTLNILTRYMGFLPTFIWNEELDKISADERVIEMPCYPEDGSIAIVDDVIVIKLSTP